MKNLLLFSLLFFGFQYLAKAQSGILPPNAEPGKCYAKCQILMQQKVKAKTLAIYTGEYPATVALDSLFFFSAPYYDHLMLIGKVRDLKFHNKREEHDIEKMIFVKDTSQTQQYVYETVDYLLPKQKTRWTEWREVLCNNQINSSVILEIAEALHENGFLKEEDINDQINSTFKAGITAYQKDNNLPMGQLDLKTLERLNISY